MVVDVAGNLAVDFLLDPTAQPIVAVLGELVVREIDADEALVLLPRKVAMVLF